MPQASLEQSLSPEVITQRDKTIIELEEHIIHLQELVTDLKKAQTMEQYLSLVRRAVQGIKHEV